LKSLQQKWTGEKMLPAWSKEVGNVICLEGWG
jgi:hypothetical protein